MCKKIIRKCRFKVVESAEKSRKLTNSSKRVFRCLLFNFFNVTDFRCFPSDAQIIEKTGLSEVTIRRARKNLIENGWIEVSQRPSEKRRRDYRFPTLQALIAEATSSSRNHVQDPGKYRSKRSSIPDKMTGIPYNTITTPKNHSEQAPLGREPVPVGSPLARDWDSVLANEALPPLSEIFEPKEYDGDSVYWVKTAKIPPRSTIDYQLTLSWMKKEAGISKQNQR